MTCSMCMTNKLLSVSYVPCKCAFDDSGAFVGDNWNCGTMNELRRLAVTGWRDDNSSSSISIVPIPDVLDDPHGYIVLTYYKDRGCTSGARICNNDEPDIPLTLRVAEVVVRELRREQPRVCDGEAVTL